MTVVKNFRAVLVGEIGDFQKDMESAAKKTEDFNKAAKNASGGTSEMNSGLKGLSGAFSSILAAGFVVKAGGMLVDFGKQAITAASDVEEMTSKFNTVFKDQAGSVETELGQIADTINRSKYDLMGYAATLQDTFVPLGFARDQAAEMSVEIVQLAEDLASFNNLNTDDVVRDLQSALVGNTETLRKYGVVANETAIKAKALELGLWDGKGAIDAQDKAAAILALTLEGTSDAQGDAAKTADSYANVSKGLDAALKDLSVTMGNKLLPAATNAKKGLTAWLELTNDTVVAWDLLNFALSEGIIDIGEFGRQLRTNDAGEIIEEITWKIEDFEEANRKAAGSWTLMKNEVEDATPSLYDITSALFNAGEVAKVAEVKTEHWLDTIDTGVGNAIGKMIDDLEFHLAGGGKLQEAFGAVTQALLDRKITEPEAHEFLGSLYIEAQYLETEINGLSFEDAAANIAEQLGIPAEEAYNQLMKIKEEGNFQITSRIDIMIEGHWKDEQVRKLVDMNLLTMDMEAVADQYRAEGGSVYAGNPYVVGERGPELFVPDTGGTIVPNDKMGGVGGMTVVQNFYDEGSTALGMAWVEYERDQRLNGRM